MQAEVTAEDLIYEIGLDRVTVIEVAAEVVVVVIALRKILRMWKEASEEPLPIRTKLPNISPPSGLCNDDVSGGGAEAAKTLTFPLIKYDTKRTTAAMKPPATKVGRFAARAILSLPQSS